VLCTLLILLRTSFNCPGMWLNVYFQAAKVMETGLQVQAEAEIVEKLKRFFRKQGGTPFSP
jgi:hypothetical protein